MTEKPLTDAELDDLEEWVNTRNDGSLYSDNAFTDMLRVLKEVRNSRSLLRDGIEVCGKVVHDWDEPEMPDEISDLDHWQVAAQMHLETTLRGDQS